jgi:hypothetical protein
MGFSQAKFNKLYLIDNIKLTIDLVFKNLAFEKIVFISCTACKNCIVLPDFQFRPGF